VGHFLTDIRYALRTFRKSPVFVAVAVLSLALVSARDTAIFTLVDQVLLRLLPVKDPRNWCCCGTGATLRQQQRPTKSLTRCTRTSAIRTSLQRNVLPRRHRLQLEFRRENRAHLGELVSGSYFPVLGVGAALGRVFNENDDRTPGGVPYAVLSYRSGISRFAGDRGIIGKK